MLRGPCSSASSPVIAWRSGPNSAHWIILQQGISLAGMIVAADPGDRSHELEHILSRVHLAACSISTPTVARTWRPSLTSSAHGYLP